MPLKKKTAHHNWVSPDDFTVLRLTRLLAISNVYLEVEI